MADIRIGVDADTKPAATAIRKGLYEPLEDVDDAIRDVEHASDGMADAIADASRRSSRSLKAIDDDGIRPASEGIREFKQEAVANFSEVASSFNGDITQMADGVQGLTGGLASALTPGIGIPLAILGAAGGAFLQSWITATEDSKERVGDMYDDMLESGQQFLSEDFIQKAIGDIGKDAEKWGDAQKHVEETGLSIQTILRAMVGDADAINTVLDTQKTKHDENLKAISASEDTLEQKAILIDAENTKYGESVDWLKQIQADTDTAASKAAAVTAAYGTGNKALDEQTRKIQDLAAAIGGIGDKTIKISADTTGVEGALQNLQGRTIKVNVNGQITQIGNQVW